MSGRERGGSGRCARAAMVVSAVGAAVVVACGPAPSEGDPTSPSEGTPAAAGYGSSNAAEQEQSTQPGRAEDEPVFVDLLVLLAGPEAYAGARVRLRGVLYSTPAPEAEPFLCQYLPIYGSQSGNGAGDSEARTAARAETARRQGCVALAGLDLLDVEGAEQSPDGGLWVYRNVELDGRLQVDSFSRVFLAVERRRFLLPFACPYGEWISTNAAAWIRGVLREAELPLEDCTGSAFVTRVGDRDLYVWAFEVSGPVEGEPNYVMLGEVEGAVVRGASHRAVWAAQGLAVWVEAGPTSNELPGFGALAPLVAASLAVSYPDFGDGALDGGRTGQRLAHGGVAITVPRGWDGRVLFLDPRGNRAILQLANFELPGQEGFEPPPELPPGEEDRIKSMSGNDVLVTIEPAPRGEFLEGHATLSAADFLPFDVPRVPRGHALAQRTFCTEGRCLRITADFGRGPPEESVLDIVNAALATLSVAPGELP